MVTEVKKGQKKKALITEEHETVDVAINPDLVKKK